MLINIGAQAHTQKHSVTSILIYTQSLFVPIHQITCTQHHTLIYPSSHTNTVVLHPSNIDACHTGIHLFIHMHSYSIYTPHVPTSAALPIWNHGADLWSSELNSSLKIHLARNITQRPLSCVKPLFPLFLSHTSFEVGIGSFQGLCHSTDCTFLQSKRQSFSSFIPGHTTTISTDMIAV